MRAGLSGVPGGDISETHTRRLVLRRMIGEHWSHLRLIDSDPQVVATLGGLRSVEESKAYALAQERHWDEHGFGWWSVFDRASNEFVGRGGIRYLQIEGTREVEVGYALVASRWGEGLASEIASAAMEIGFKVLGLDRIVGVTLPTNHASRRVLEKAGLRYSGEVLHHQLRHVLYVGGRPVQQNRETLV